MNMKQLSCASALALFALPIFAQHMPPAPTPAVPPAPEVPSVSDSERSHWDNESRLKKQLRLMRLHAQIAEAQREIDGEGSKSMGGGRLDAVNISRPPMAPSLMRPGSSPPGTDSILDFTPPPPPEPVRRAGTFDVVGIWGIDGDHTADVLNNGMRIAVREGDPLPNGWKVDSIRRTGVVITKGKQRETLVVASRGD